MKYRNEGLYTIEKLQAHVAQMGAYVLEEGQGSLSIDMYCDVKNCPHPTAMRIVSVEPADNPDGHDDNRALCAEHFKALGIGHYALDNE